MSTRLTSNFPDNSAPAYRHCADCSCNCAVLSSSSCFTEGNSKVHVSVDLVAAARRHLLFLRCLIGSPLLYHVAVILRSIRRYEEIWMPLMANLSSESSSVPMILPPPDVGWIWLCHCLHPESYRKYCTGRFGFLIDRPVIIDEDNEEYASGRCREMWEIRHPLEPFDLEIDADDPPEAAVSGVDSGSKIFEMVTRHEELCSFFADPFVLETVYLVSARRRYLNFLQLPKNSADGSLRMVPASDILLLWHTHQSFPGIYLRDLEGMGDFGWRVAGFGDQASSEEKTERTRRVWEATFDEPYERAGVIMYPPASPRRLCFSWETSDSDVNRTYKCLQPRFLIEVAIFLKGKWEQNESNNLSKTFLRVRTLRCHKELKLDKPAFESSCQHWRKTWHLFCEFGTRGIMIEVRQHGRGCLSSSSKLLKRIYFYWNDLLHSTTLTLVQELDFGVRALSSLTPPVQAPYLLKCVPDCVSDDSGAMVSDVILRMNRYRPQEGRWLSRTILDHAGKECFIIRTRVGRGFWRRGAETPVLVKWEERIVEVREGQWSYIASSVGRAPQKVVGTATPNKEDSRDVWSLSTGDVLTIQWEHGLSFKLVNENLDHSVMLLQGRKLQYQLKEPNPEEEQHYITLIRSTHDNPQGKATALLNWKLQAVEFLPEEDAVLVLLLNMAVLRTISRVRREDVGGLLSRRRFREVAPGLRDWGSVLLPSSSSSFTHCKPWYWNNAEEVLASAEANDWRGMNHKYSAADGKEELYRLSLFS